MRKVMIKGPAVRILTFVSAIMASVVNGATPEDLAGQAMDPTANPCRNFYRYACGGWISGNGIPDDAPSRVRGFAFAQTDINDRLASLFQEAADRYPSGNTEQDLVGAMYRSCLAADDGPGLSALQPTLRAIDRVTNVSDFLRLAAQLHAMGVSRLFSLFVSPDPRASFHTLFALAGDPGFDDGDIYYRQDRDSRALRAAEADYIVDVLEQLGESRRNALAYSKDILAIEATLSRHHVIYSATGGRTYPLSASSDIALLEPTVPWGVFFDSLPLRLSAGLWLDGDMLQEMAPLLLKLTPASLRAYLRWSLIGEYRSFLPSTFNRSIAREVIYRLPQKPRQQQCIDATSDLLADVVAKMLVLSDGSVQRAPRVRQLVSAVKEGFGRRIERASWLSPDAAAAARAKLNALNAKVGFPRADWVDYSSLTLSTSDFLANAVAARRLGFAKLIEYYETPVNRNSWDFAVTTLRPGNTSTVQTVNAFYIPLLNQIYLLAGITRPSFLYLDAPLPMSYGSLGYVSGHEITHGFDTSGRNFQANGNTGRLFSEQINEAFDQRAQCISDQYARYRTSGGIRVKSSRTLDENIADVGGLAVSYEAFKRVARSQPASYSVGSLTLSAEQLFFVSFAQTFCAVSRPGVEDYLSSRTWWRYAPYRYRVIGPLVNSPGFAKAFSCPLGTPMNPVQKCRVW